MLLSVVVLCRLCLHSAAVFVIPAERERPSARSQPWGFLLNTKAIKKKNLSKLKSNLKTRGTKKEEQKKLNVLLSPIC